MKRTVAALVLLILILTASSGCLAKESPQSYMELSVTGAWSIYTKDMKDEELLASVKKSAEEINEILNNTGSESVIINRETGAQIYVKINKNELSYKLWDIKETDNSYITENLKTILYDGFLMNGLNYQDENVAINDYAYMKFITVSGSTYYNGKAHGVVCGGSFVNGNSIVFMMLTQDTVPKEEEIAAVNEIASGVSFTVIKEKTAEVTPDKAAEEKNVFNYILGGFGALVVIIFCAYMIARMRTKDEEVEEPKNSEERKEKSE